MRCQTQLKLVSGGLLVQVNPINRKKWLNALQMSIGVITNDIYTKEDEKY